MRYRVFRNFPIDRHEVLYFTLANSTAFCANLITCSVKRKLLDFVIIRHRRIASNGNIRNDACGSDLKEVLHETRSLVHANASTTSRHSRLSKRLKAVYVIL